MVDTKREESGRDIARMRKVLRNIEQEVQLVAAKLAQKTNKMLLHFLTFLVDYFNLWYIPAMRIPTDR